MRYLSILFLTILIVACTGDKRETSSHITLYQYQTAMRWGQWDLAFSSRSKEAPPVPTLSLDTIRVTAYEVLQPPILVAENQILQVVEIQYVRTDVQRVRKIVDKQDWRYDGEKNVWLLYSPFPDFK